MGQHLLRIGHRTGAIGFSQVLYPEVAAVLGPTVASDSPHMNPLIHRWFGTCSHKRVKFFLRRNIEGGLLGIKKISLAKFWFRITLLGRAEFVRFQKERAKMAWKTPKIVEVPVGMEINMYACAARK
jgi:coenzyme PQQ precursor peptide PqqA